MRFTPFSTALGFIFALTALTSYSSSAQTPQPEKKPLTQQNIGPITPLPLPVGQTTLPTFESSVQELILKMQLRHFLINDGFIGYLTQGGVLLPLDEVMRTLNFPISVNPAAGQAQGWFLRENQKFSLDIPRNEVVVKGEITHFDPDLMYLRPDDIYVDTTLLSKWFPVDFEFVLSSLMIKASSREPLPLEEKLEREKKRSGLGRGIDKPVYPRQETPYRLLDWQFIDTTYSLDYDNETEKTQGRYNSLIAGDLLNMNSQLFLSGANDEALQDLRLEVGRKDPGGELLGLLKAQEFSFGDIFTTQTPLIANSQTGRGLEISNFPLNRPSEFDRTTLRGELPLGWEVELYRNEILLDSQVTPDASGRYEFIDVPLLFGLNILRRVFYGPQGQRREEVQRIFAGEDLVQPGKQYYRLGVNQKNKDLFRVGEDSRGTVDGEERYLFEYERGISKLFSVSTSLASLPFEKTRRNYATLGLRSAFFGMFSRLDVSRNDQGGTAAQAAVQANFFDINLFAEHAQFYDFVSERVPLQSDPADSLSEVRVDGVIPAFWRLPRLPITLAAQMEQLESGRTNYQLANRASLYYKGISFSNNSLWTLSRGGDIPDITTSSSSFLLSGRVFDRLSLRGTLDYSVQPKIEFKTVSATGDYDFSRDFSSRVTVTRQLTGEPLTSVSLGLNRRFKMAALGVNGAYQDDGNYTIGSTLTFSLGRNPHKKNLFVQSDRIATSGAASARVFLDHNQSGDFDAGDEPIEGAHLRPGPIDLKTDEDGLAMITGLSSHSPVNVTLDQSSLEDPFWLPVRKGVELVPRPGRSVLLDFPVILTGEVDGTVYLLQEDITKAVSDVELQLVNLEGEVVKQTKTAFDGFYLFTLVPLGKYILRVSPEQVQRLELTTSPEQEVAINTKEPVMSGRNILIKQAQQP